MIGFTIFGNNNKKKYNVYFTIYDILYYIKIKGIKNIMYIYVLKINKYRIIYSN